VKFGANGFKSYPTILLETSRAILAAFAERGIRFVKDSLVRALDAGQKSARSPSRTMFRARGQRGQRCGNAAAQSGSDRRDFGQVACHD
jgi:hypothetical protein